MPKPTIGQSNWGGVLNDYLDTEAARVTAAEAALARIERQRFDIEDYGASTDGTGDNTAAVIAALAAANAAGGGTIWLPRPVDYLCTTTTSAGGLTWVIPITQDNVTFDGVPGSGLKTTANAALLHINGAGKPAGMANWPSYFLHGGDNTPTTALIAINAVDKGDKVVTPVTAADTSGWVAGDLVYIRTGHVSPLVAGSTIPDAEINEVASRNGTTGAITLRWPAAKTYVQENYPAGAHAQAGNPAPFGMAKVTDRVLRNVTVRNIRLISTSTSYVSGMMPEGQVYGLTFEDVYVESGMHFQLLNNVRKGRYRNLDINLTNASDAQTYWWITTATGTTDVIAENVRGSAVSTGVYHVHEGSAQVTIRDCKAHSAHVAGDHPSLSVRDRAYDISVDGLAIVGGGNDPVYIDASCDDGGSLSRVTVDSPATSKLFIGASGWTLDPVTLQQGVTFYNNDAAGVIAGGSGPFGAMHIAGWVADSNLQQILGLVPANAVVKEVWVHVTEAFTGTGSYYRVNVGTVADMNTYIQIIPLTALGWLKGTDVGFVANIGRRALEETAKAYVVTDGGAPTAGKALILLEYVNAPAPIA